MQDRSCGVADLPFGPEFVDGARYMTEPLLLRHEPDGGEYVLRANPTESSTGLTILTGARGTERRQVSSADQELPHFRPPTASWTSQVPLYSAQSWQVKPDVRGIPSFGRSVDQFYVPEGQILDLIQRDLLPQPHDAAAYVTVPSSGGANMQGFGQVQALSLVQQQAIAERAIADVGIPPTSPSWKDAINVALDALKGIIVPKGTPAPTPQPLYMPAPQPVSVFSSPWVLIPVGALAAYVLYTQVLKR